MQDIIADIQRRMDEVNRQLGLLEAESDRLYQLLVAAEDEQDAAEFGRQTVALQMGRH